MAAVVPPDDLVDCCTSGRRHHVPGRNDVIYCVVCVEESLLGSVRLRDSWKLVEEEVVAVDYLWDVEVASPFVLGSHRVVLQHILASILPSLVGLALALALALVLAWA